MLAKRNLIALVIAGLIVTTACVTGRTGRGGPSSDLGEFSRRELNGSRSSPVSARPGGGASEIAAPTEAFRVDVTGHGPPMILIPGLASSGKVWDGTVAHYQDRYECHVLTLAGFAGQPKIEIPLLPAVRDGLVEYIREKRLQRPVMIGHSLGGSVALALAEAQPNLIGPLVIVDSLPFFGGINNPDTTREMAAKQADAIRQRMLTATPDQRNAYERTVLSTMISDPAKVDIAMQWYSQSDPSTVANSFADLFSIDLRPELSRIGVPVLVLGTWIAYKQYATREQVEQTFRRQYSGLKDWRLMLVDRARHFMMWDDPETMFKETDEFLASASKRVAALR